MRGWLVLIFLTAVVFVILISLHRQVTTMAAMFSPPPSRSHAMVETMSVANWALPIPRPRESTSENSAIPVMTEKAIEAADAYLASHREEWGLQPHHEFRPTAFQSPLGTTVKYDVYQDDLPIEGMELRILVGQKQEIVQTEKNYQPVQKLDLGKQVYLSPEEVLERNSETLISGNETESAPSQVLFAASGSPSPQLAYVFSARERNGTNRMVTVMVRATDGQILKRTFPRPEF